MSDTPEDKGKEREVGYKKPPVHTQFKKGNGGRPKGVKNKLSKAFLEDMFAAWEERGSEAIERTINEKPEVFLKTVASLVPKDINLHTERDVEKMTEADIRDELAEIAETLAAVGIVARKGSEGETATGQATKH